MSLALHETGRRQAWLRGHPRRAVEDARAMDSIVDRVRGSGIPMESRVLPGAVSYGIKVTGSSDRVYILTIGRGAPDPVPFPFR